MTTLFTFFKGLGWSFFLWWDFVDGIRVFTAFLKIGVWNVIFEGNGIDGRECGGSGEVWMVLLRSGGSELPEWSGWSATSLLPLWGFGYNLFFKIRIMG